MRIPLLPQHLDLSRALYVLYGVKYIGLVSPAGNKPVPQRGETWPHYFCPPIDLDRALYVMFCMVLNI